MKSCGKAPNPILRSEYEAEVEAVVEALRRKGK
jgi:hypothetical protein